MAEMKAGYKQTDVGVIPEDWDIKPVSALCEIVSGGTPSTANPDFWFKGDIPWCTPSDITGTSSKYLNGTDRNITSLGLSKSSANLLPEGSLLLCSRATIGEVKIAKRQIATNQGFKSLVCHSINNEFMYYKVLTLKDRLLQFSTGSTFLEFSKKDIARLQIDVPKPEEQKQIVAALSDVDGLIESLEKLIAKKRDIKTAAMQQLLTGKKRLPGFGGEWSIKTLKDLSKILTKQTGFDYSTNIKPTLINTPKKGYIPFIQNKDFSGAFINYQTDYYVPKNIAFNFPQILLGEKCLLVSISGCIGNVGLFSNVKTSFLGGAVAVIKFKNKKFIDWCLHYLSSEEGQMKLSGNVKSSSHQNLTLDDLRNVSIPIPEQSEQDAISKLLGDMDAEINALEQRLDKARNLKTGMMQELLTGKTRLIKTTKSRRRHEKRAHYNTNR